MNPSAPAPMAHPVVNFVGYQLVWFACVLGGARGWPWLGVGAAWLWIAIHLVATRRPRADASLIAIAAGTGLLVDSLLQLAGLLHYASPWSHPSWIAPPWIVSLWAGFATTLRHSLRWLTRRAWVAALGGAVFGPLAFRAGEALGAVRFASERWMTYGALSVVWALAMALLATRIARLEPARRPAETRQRETGAVA